MLLLDLSKNDATQVCYEEPIITNKPLMITVIH